MKTIKVRVVKTKRDGFVLKWGSSQEKCSGKTQRAREAERVRKEHELNDDTRLESWAEFWSSYKIDELSGMTASHRSKCEMMERRLVAVAKQQKIKHLMCNQISKKLMAAVETMMRSDTDVVEATIKSNMGTLWGIITWGQDNDRLPSFRRPRKRRSKRAKKSKSKGRAITSTEFGSMLACIDGARRSHEERDAFVTAAYAAKHLGMRKSELWLFSWEPIDGAHYPIRLYQEDPAIIFSDEQKSGENSEVPITPDAANWLKSLPRRGGLWVCRTRGARGMHKTPDRLGRVISEAGRRAEIVVKRIIRPSGKIITKHASLHDLRRTYAVAMIDALGVSDTVKMTRHADASVLLDYYSNVPTPELYRRVSGGFSGGFQGDDEKGKQPKNT